MSATATEAGTAFSRAEVARCCRAWGKMLWLPPEIDGVKLLWALSGNESSFGANAKPRHEPAYDVGGLYAKNPEQAKLLELYGSAAACSYGPWQLLLVNATPPASPADMESLDRSAMATVQFINRRILNPDLGARRAATVEEIAEAYNSGKWTWQATPPGVARYAEDCRAFYDAAGAEMPPAAA